MFSFEGAGFLPHNTMLHIVQAQYSTCVIARRRHSQTLCWFGRGKGNRRGEKQTKRVQTSMYAPLAQLVEQLTLNQWVPGSSP